VQTWVDGDEDAEFVGVGARFGRTIVSKEKYANRTKLSLADPADCCTPPTKVYHTHTQPSPLPTKKNTSHTQTHTKQKLKLVNTIDEEVLRSMVNAFFEVDEVQ
jgi:hypothetical protein